MAQAKSKWIRDVPNLLLCKDFPILTSVFRGSFHTSPKATSSAGVTRAPTNQDAEFVVSSCFFTVGHH